MPTYTVRITPKEPPLRGTDFDRFHEAVGPFVVTPWGAVPPPYVVELPAERASSVPSVLGALLPADLLAKLDVRYPED